MIVDLKSFSLKRFTLSTLLVLLSAFLLSFCFPGMGDVGGLIFIWAFPFLFALFSLSEKHTFWKGLGLGYLCGLGFWLLNLKWLLRMADLDFVPLGGAIFAWLLLPAYLALYFGIFGALVAKWGNPWKATQPKLFKTRIDEKIAAKQQQQKNSSNKLLESFKESTTSLRFAFMHASLWTLLEWVRSILFTGFSWNGLGVAFYDIPVLAQSAELVGVIGLSFAPMFVTSVVFQVLCRMVKEVRVGRMKPHFDLIVAGLLIAAMFGFGISRLFSLTSAETKDVGFLLIQQNLSLDQKHAASSHIGNMSDYTQASLEGLENVHDANKATFTAFQNNPESEGEVALDRIDFIVWPESTLLRGVSINQETNVPYFTEVESNALTEIISQGSHGLITGANEYHFANEVELFSNPPSSSYNSIGLFRGIPGESMLESIYRKNHLVIFGEYIPYRDTFPLLEKIVGASHGSALGPNYSPGGDTEPMKTLHDNEELHLIGAVCFEDTVGRLTRQSVRDADQVIVNVTNDGWFGNCEEPKQHYANALFRTIELRRPMVRSANTGISCIINVKGSMENEDGSLNAIVNEQGEYFTKGSLHAYAHILKSAPITLYALAGDWFAAACAVIYLFTLVSSLKQRAA